MERGEGRKREVKSRVRGTARTRRREEGRGTRRKREEEREI